MLQAVSHWASNHIDILLLLSLLDPSLSLQTHEAAEASLFCTHSSSYLEHHLPSCLLEGCLLVWGTEDGQATRQKIDRGNM